MKIARLFQVGIPGLLAVALFWGSAVAQIANRQLEELDGVGVTEHLDELLPLGLDFTDETNQPIKLADYFNQDRPVILTLNYYGCPMLCGLHLNGLVEALRQLDWVPGREYEMVTASINPDESYTLAKLKKQNYLKDYSWAEAADGWHFLTGEQPEITELADAVGFGYKYIEKTGQFSHAAVTMILTPEGRLSRYLYGVVYQPKTLRYSLVEASEGRIGSTLDQFILFCFQYDPQQGKYSPFARNLMRAGGFLTILILGSVLVGFWLRDARKKKAKTAEVHP